jgi:hypothetical protein
MREQIRLSQKMGISKTTVIDTYPVKESYDKIRATLDSYSDIKLPSYSISSGRQTVLCTKSDKLVGVKEDERYEVITLHPFVIRSLISGSVISEADPTLFILA